MKCGAPIVSIPGGEPLIHPEMAEIVRGLVERGEISCIFVPMRYSDGAETR